MRYIRFFFITIILQFIILSLSGCNSMDQKVTLQLSDWHLTENVWKKSLTEAIEEFEKQNPNIDVVLEPVLYGDMNFKYFTESEAGMAPDVFHIYNSSFQTYFAKGYVMDLTKFIKSEGGEQFLSNWYDLPINACKYDGKLMAMPADFMSMVLYYNTKMFRSAGINEAAPPKTWVEFLKMNRMLTMDKNNDGSIDQWGFAMIGANDPGFELRLSPFIWAFGGDYLTEDLKHSALNRPQTITGFKYFIELYTKHGVVPQGILRTASQGARVQLAQEKAAMLIGSGWTIPIVNDMNPTLHAEEVLEAAPVPYNDVPVTSAWLSGWVISSHTKYPKESWKLIKFLTSKEMELKWFRDNKVLSSRKDVSSTAPEILQDKYAKVIASQLPYAKLVPQIKEWPQIREIIMIAVQESINGEKTPEEALLNAHEKVEKLIRRDGSRPVKKSLVTRK